MKKTEIDQPEFSPSEETRRADPRIEAITQALIDNGCENDDGSCREQCDSVLDYCLPCQTDWLLAQVIALRTTLEERTRDLTDQAGLLDLVRRESQNRLRTIISYRERAVTDPCELCKGGTANGVWVCDVCLDALKAKAESAEATRDEYWADLCEIKAGTGVVPQALYDEAMKRAGAAEATLTAARIGPCRGGAPHYCPNCDRSFGEAALGSSPAATKEESTKMSPRKCVIGEFCDLHGFVHGAEAEELRERLARLNSRKVNAILDDVDARDSCAYVESRGCECRDGGDAEPYEADGVCYCGSCNKQTEAVIEPAVKAPDVALTSPAADRKEGQ